MSSVIALAVLAGSAVFLGPCGASAATLQQSSFAPRWWQQSDLHIALESGIVAGAILMLTGISLAWWLRSRRTPVGWQTLALLLLCMNQILLPSTPEYEKVTTVVIGLCPLVLLIYLRSLTREHKLHLPGMSFFMVLGALQTLLCLAMVVSDRYLFIQASEFSALSILFVLILAGVHQLKTCRLRYRVAALSGLAVLWGFSLHAVLLGGASPIPTKLSAETYVSGLPIAVAFLLGFVFWTHNRTASRRSNETRAADLLSRQDQRVSIAVKHHTQTLNASLAEAQRTNLQQTRLMAYVGHDLRAPMASIVGYAKLLRNSGNSSHTKHIAAIEHGAAHQLVLIDELLDHVRGELRLFTLNPVALNLRELLQAIEQHALSLTAQNNNTFVFDLPDAFPDWVSIDGNRLSQVLLNLISNAAKFTHEGTVTLAITCSMKLSIWTMQFDITDTGTGILVEDQERIFGSFEQAQPTDGGLGLGLFIARSIVENMGGRLTLTSVPGTGSTFQFALTMVTVDAPLAPCLPATTCMEPAQSSIAPMAATVQKTSPASLIQLSRLASAGQWTEIKEWIAHTSVVESECGEFVSTIAILFDDLDFQGIRQLASSDNLADTPISQPKIGPQGHTVAIPLTNYRQHLRRPPSRHLVVHEVRAPVLV